eukprot:TRINITY_DN3602_c0_g1_i1.p1 TRINITY_DN3602_c0_g1~~TRINITY_DN3602_c0_g1_i1.p1  ORF type:complete len:754 (+),score=147.16 TRINITY_DN3602_c0_g1_i1:113-2263(+)
MVDVLLLGAGAAAGVAGIGAVAGGGRKLQNLAGRYARSSHKEQAEKVEDLIRHLINDGAMPTTFVLDGLKKTTTQLRATTPSFPQLKLAHDAILKYQDQRNMKRKSVTRTLRVLGGATYVDDDPKTVVCEFLKAWISEKIEAINIEASEVVAYRNLAAGLLRYPDLFTETFRQTMGHFADHCGDILKLQLRQTRSADQLLRKLQTEVYAFTLQSFKICLLTATNFEVPKDLYSLDSLAMIQRTSLPPSMLKDSSFEKMLAEKTSRSWKTDCGKLGKVLLYSPYMLNLCSCCEAMQHAQTLLPVTVEVERATRLPTRAMDETDPYITVEVTLDGKLISSADTRYKLNTTEPVWNQSFFLEVPRASAKPAESKPSGKSPALDSSPSKPGSASGHGCDRNYEDMSNDVVLSFQASDWCETLGGRAGNITFAMAEAGVTELKSALVGSPAVGRHFQLPLSPIPSVAAMSFVPSTTDGAGPVLDISIREPNFEVEVADMRRAWGEASSQGQKLDNVGLRSPELGDAFLVSMEALDHFAYFSDIILGTCGSIARSRGDFGIVSVASTVLDLLDEVDQRTSDADAAARSLIGGADDILIAAARSKTSVPLTPAERALQEESRHSRDMLKQLKERISGTTTELRSVCKQYQELQDVFSREACSQVVDLQNRLRNDETGRRTTRFATSDKKSPAGRISIVRRVRDNVAVVGAGVGGFISSPRPAA